MYLIDTNVISELRRARPQRAVVAWLEGVAERDLFVAAVTIGELQAGVELTRDQDPGKAGEIEAWVEKIAMTYNVLAMDAAIFRRWTKLMHHRSDGFIEDAMIAATAQTHGLVVVTRNVKDFAQLEVPTLNPFEA
jgi:toxin FitB